MRHTEYFRVDRQHPDPCVLAHMADILRQGGLVAFPTETVYGLGANGLDQRAVAGIYRAKGRPADNPLILHIADHSGVEKLARHIPAKAWLLIKKYWPGPLTLVLERTRAVPDIITAGLDTVAIRFPASRVACELIQLAGVPIAAPSANTSGRPSPTNALDVMADMEGRIDGVLDAGPCDIGVESTVLDCTTPVPTILRPGGITLEMLRDTLGEVEMDKALLDLRHGPARAPGMKYTHYAPAAPMTLIEGQPEHRAAKLREVIVQALAAGQRIGAVVSAEAAVGLPPETVLAVYGSRYKPEDIAANLYTALRYFDDTPVDSIFAEGMEEEGIGLAVMNRMRKAAGYRIIKV
jgi:L-threonylcarbamoyladenylate synthase